MKMYSKPVLREFKLQKYYSLIASVAISDLRLRYKNSFLGFVWTFLQPLLFLGVLYTVFSSWLGSQVPDFPLYLLIGLILWNSFSRSTGISMMSFIAMSGLISKIYFPREILPISANIMSFIMMLFDLGAFGVFMVIFHFIPPATIVYFPILLIILFMLNLGLSFILSVANVYFRDLEHIWGIVLQAGFFLVPIFLTMTLYPPSVRHILIFNPMMLMIDTAHNVVLYNITPSFGAFGYLFVSALSLLVLGYAIFKKFEAKAVELL